MPEFPLITAPNLKDIPGLLHAFTTRQGGVSQGTFSSLNLGRESGDLDESVDQNYERLAQAMKTAQHSLIGSHQVHGATVLCVETGEKMMDYWSTDADALVTKDSGKFLTVRVADCLPILLVDSAHHAVGAVHAGWRGTLANVLGAAISEMQKKYQTDAASLKIAIGPGIGICCYEVSFGISALMEQQFGLHESEVQQTEGGVKIDLARINRRLAEQCGARSEQIWLSGQCTRCDEKNFFSYRRDGKQSGRQVGIIGWAT